MCMQNQNQQFFEVFFLCITFTLPEEKEEDNPSPPPPNRKKKPHKKPQQNQQQYNGTQRVMEHTTAWILGQTIPYKPRVTEYRIRKSANNTFIAFVRVIH